MTEYTIDELMVTRIAEEVREGGVTVFGSFTPLAYTAYMLALRTHAQNAVVVGYNSIGMRPVRLDLTGMEGAAYRGCVARWSFVELTNAVHLGGRGMVECISPAQLDGRGRFNASAIGPDYDRPKVRLPGGAGSPEVMQNYPTMVAYFGRHDRRTLVESVDFATGGRSPIAADERAAKGIPTGPILVVTPLCVLTKDDDRPFVVTSLHPGIEMKEVVENTGFELRIPDVVPTTGAPTDDQIRLIRSEIDPYETRRFDLLDARARAVMVDSILDDEWAQAELAAGVGPA
ncbi:CoA-transferase [Actinomycetes bacterium M1A6_2h]